MTIFRTAYDTTVGSGFSTTKTVNAIKESFVRDYINNSNGDLATVDGIIPVFVTGSSTSEASIPFFSHPLQVEGLNKAHHLCIDVRPFVKFGLQNTEFQIKNQTEFNFAKNRLALNLIWNTSPEVNLRDVSFVPNAVFSSWISENLARRFALDPKDQIILAIISSFYYQTLFTNETEFSEEQRLKMATSVIRATRAPAKMVFEVTDRIESIGSLNEFTNTCKMILENTRINDLNAGLIISILGGSWFGMNAKEILAVSFEHPPTWISLVYASLVERTFKNSMIAKIADRYAGNKGGTDFIHSFGTLVNSVTKSKSSSKEDNDYF